MPRTIPHPDPAVDPTRRGPCLRPTPKGTSGSLGAWLASAPPRSRSPCSSASRRPRPPLAEDPAYTTGLTLFEDFEYEKAVFRFQEALEVKDRSAADRATILIRLGMTWAELRRNDKATARFKEALLLDPLAALPPDASPKIKEMLDGARRQLREEASAAPADPAPADTGEVLQPEALAAPEAAPDSKLPETAPTDAPPEAAEAGGLPWLMISGGSVVGIGVVGALLGGALWAGGLGLRQVGSGQAFQSDAVALDLPARAGQIAGQVVLGVGVVALLAGGAVVLTAVVVE
jgi:tetratricopeptide (TPR) repeat protein